MYGYSIQPSSMIRQPVTSSNLQSVGYDPTSGILEIEFKNGSIYQYTGVPREIYQELMTAPSHGKFHARYIRDQYPYSKVR